jgi:hypothetical protein
LKKRRADWLGRGLGIRRFYYASAVIVVHRATHSKPQTPAVCAIPLRENPAGVRVFAIELYLAIYVGHDILPVSQGYRRSDAQVRDTLAVRSPSLLVAGGWIVAIGSQRQNLTSTMLTLIDQRGPSFCQQDCR